MEKIESISTGALTLITQAKTGKGIVGVGIYFIDQFLLFDNLKLFIVVVTFWALDMILGMIVAYVQDKFDYKRITKGIGKLIVYLCYVGIGIGLNELYGTGGIAYSIILGAVIVQETISIFDKFEKLGYATPMRIKQYLPKIQKDVNKNK